jgi:hypothetical protein
MPMLDALVSVMADDRLVGLENRLAAMHMHNRLVDMEARA